MTQISLFLVLVIGLLFIAIGSTGTISPSMGSNNLILNNTYVIDETGTTPFNVWAGAIILGLVLILISFAKFPNGEEGLVSIMAWIPTGYAMFASFTVDRITGSMGGGVVQSGVSQYVIIEHHTVYHFDIIGVMLFILLLFAIGNTYRIYANMKRINELSQTEQTWHERNGGFGNERGI